MQPMVNIALRAARLAGEMIVKSADNLDLVKVDEKGRHDFVTEVDRRSEETIIYHINKAYPDHRFIGEESGISGNADAEVEWIIDPLDGTTNFLHGLPHWAVSIALEHKGQIVAGVVYDPTKDEMFIAEKGQGAWLNDSRLRVSGRKRMIESIYATGLPFAGRSDLPETLKDLAQLLPACAGVRRWGAAALDLAYVAAGRYDGYWERRLNVWDIAAGVIIAREAGAIVEGIAANSDPIETADILCANDLQFNQFAALIRGA